MSQHGVLTTGQLLELGVSEGALRRRVEAGRLHRIHRAVYAVGTPSLTRDGRFMAAVLAAGDGGALSHGSAAWLWDIRDGLLSPIDVTIPNTNGRKPRPGLRIHRPRPPLETTTHRGIRVTTVPRTLIDLAETITPRQLERAIDEAHFLGLLRHPDVDATLVAHAGRSGAARLRRALDSHTPGTTRTRSIPEEAFLAFCRRHRLPPPVLNATIDHLTVDALFPEQRVIVEIDPWHTHGDPGAFATDRARDRHLLAAGYRTARIPPDQLTAATAAELRRILAG